MREGGIIPALGSMLVAGLGVFLGTLTKGIMSLFAAYKVAGLMLYSLVLLHLFPGIPEMVGKRFPTCESSIWSLTSHSAVAVAAARSDSRMGKAIDLCDKCGSA